MNTPLNVRSIELSDISRIFSFIKELAIYEKAEQEVVTNIDRLCNTLFCDNPRVFGLICEYQGHPIGFAIYFYNYSTWLGKHGIYLEDLYVTPKQRGLGAGKALLKHLAKIAVAEDCGRIEWSVLDWNTPAIKFYENLNAVPQSEWTVYRLTGRALTRLGTR